MIIKPLSDYNDDIDFSWHRNNIINIFVGKKINFTISILFNDKHLVLLIYCVLFLIPSVTISCVKKNDISKNEYYCHYYIEYQYVLFNNIV